MKFSVTTQSIRRAMVAGLATVVMGSFGAHAQAPAAAPDVKTQAFGNWRMACQTPKNGGAEVCEIQQVARDKDKKPIAGITLVKHGGGIGLVTRVPMGVYLRKNPTLQVDNGTGTDGLSYLRCGNGSCVARMTATEPFLAAMRKGTELSLTFFADDDKPISVKFALNGFSDAESALNGKKR